MCIIGIESSRLYKSQLTHDLMSNPVFKSNLNTIYHVSDRELREFFLVFNLVNGRIVRGTMLC